MSRVCVIINPQAGRGRGKKRGQRIRHLLDGCAEFWSTEYPGAGVELGRKAADLRFSMIIAAGGDGTVHDVANGILLSQNPDVTLGLIPIGSANDYVWSCAQQFGSGSRISDLAALEVDRELNGGELVDVGQATAANGLSRYFVESIGTGLSGRVTMESRRIAWLQGLALYGLAAVRALRAQPVEHVEIAIDGQPSTWNKTLMLSMLIGKREGGFLLAPQAVMNDGQFEFVHVGPISSWEAISMLPRLATTGPPTNHPQIHLGRCSRIDLASDSPFVAHCDGEILCRPEDGLHELRIEIHPQRLRVHVFKN